MKKWNELDSKEQERALEVNLQPQEGDSIEDICLRKDAWVGLVSTGPYYFDQQGVVYTHTA